MNEGMYRNAMNSIEQSADFEQKTMDRIAQEAKGKSKKSNRGKAIFASAAAVLLIAVLIVALPLLSDTTTIRLPNSSKGITAEYVQDAPQQPQIHAKLMWFSEEELFSHPTAIFSGTVTEAKNIKIAVTDDITYYWAVIKIKAEEVYRGSIKAGDTVRVLLRCPLGKDELFIEDSDIISKIQQGTKGIFMPTSLGSQEVSPEDGVRLVPSDLAEYGFQDGLRYAFLETKQGLLYDQSAYPSIAGAKTLADVGSFVKRMAK